MAELPRSPTRSIEHFGYCPGRQLDGLLSKLAGSRYLVGQRQARSRVSFQAAG